MRRAAVTGKRAGIFEAEIFEPRLKSQSKHVA